MIWYLFGIVLLCVVIHLVFRTTKKDGLSQPTLEHQTSEGTMNDFLYCICSAVMLAYTAIELTAYTDYWNFIKLLWVALSLWGAVSGMVHLAKWVTREK